MAKQINRILPGIATYAWNGDCSRAAVCPQTREILIFETNMSPDISKWKLLQVLKEHFSNIVALDWHPKTGLLLSCSTDRGIIVWKEDPATKIYMPQLCQIKELKANTDACWNHRGDKFAVGAASGLVFVGSFDPTNGFWIARSLTDDDKPLHDGTVVSVKFDPLSSRVVASASIDGTVCVSSAYDPELDAGSTAGPFGSVSTPYKEEQDTIFKFKCSEWVNTVSFSPSGSTLSYATHDCTLHFVPITAEDVKAQNKPKGTKVTYTGAPIITGCFTNENAYIGSGYDKTPILFQKQGDWKFTKMLDDGVSKTKQSKIGKDAFGGKSVFFDGLKLENDVEVTEKDTKHMNYINCQKKFAGDNNQVQLISTSDPNGYIHFWEVSKF